MRLWSTPVSVVLQAFPRLGQGRHPPVDAWGPSVTSPATACAIPGCVLWAELYAGWCRSHHARWRQRGRPPAAEFIADCSSYGEDRFDLRPLRSGLRREIQYALQCRVDTNRTRTAPRSIKPLLDHLAATGVGSLLERPLAEWLAGLPAKASLHTPRAFLGSPGSVAHSVQGAAPRCGGWNMRPTAQVVEVPRPAHSSYFRGVDDERDVGKPRPSRDVGQVGHPQPIGCRRSEPAPHEVSRPWRSRVGDSGALGLAPGGAGQAESHISRSTVQRATAMPSRLSASHTLGAP
jgi:hypothetical protein